MKWLRVSLASLLSAGLLAAPALATTFVGPIQTYTCASHTWANSLAASTAATTCTQPAIGDLSNIAGGTVVGNPTGSAAAPTATISPVLGIASTSTGTFGLASAGGGTFTQDAANGSAVTNYTLHWPAAAPTISGQALTATTAGVGSWTSVIASAFTVSSKTTAYQLVSGTDNWKRFDNTGAGGSVIFTASASPVAGDNFCFLVTAAQTVEFLANTGQTITMANTTGGSAGNIQSNTVGSSLCVYYATTTTIYAWSSQGNWALV